MKKCGRHAVKHPESWCRSAAIRLCLCIAFIASSACGAGSPSVDSATAALRSRLDGGNEARLRLISFKKIDARAVEFMGVSAYEMLFTADAEFVTNAMFTIGSPLMSEGSEVTTAEFREPARGSSWGDFMAASQGFKPAMKGDRLHLSGSVGFEKRESGWVPTGTQFKIEHDDTTRDMEAVRIAQERRQAEEAAERKREQEREAQAARAQAEHDARAERIEVMLDGSIMCQGFHRTSCNYYLGRVTSNDVILVEPLQGTHTGLTYYVSSPVARGMEYRPGSALPDGAIGGTGGSHSGSGPVRIELPGFDSHNGKARDAIINFKGEGSIKVRVTILCTKGESDPPCRDR